jgi:hypothetical protein
MPLQAVSTIQIQNTPDTLGAEVLLGIFDFASVRQAVDQYGETVYAYELTEYGSVYPWVNNAIYGNTSYGSEAETIHWWTIWTGRYAVDNIGNIANSTDRVLKQGIINVADLNPNGSIPDNTPPPGLPSRGTWGVLVGYRGGGYFYPYTSSFVLTQKWFGRPIIHGHSQYITTATNDIRHPNYRDLVGGYQLDNRSIPQSISFTAPTTEIITVSYYRQNKLESIPNLKTIDWHEQNYNLTENQQITINIPDCVLGTLRISSQAVGEALYNSSPNSNEYSNGDLSEYGLPNLFSHWNDLYNAENLNPNNYYIFPETHKLHILGANNNWWNNRPTSTADVNFDSQHPMYRVDNQRAYDWHIKPVDDSNGDLTMDSPRIKEIHAALQAQSYLVEDETVDPKLHTLDWYIKHASTYAEYCYDDLYGIKNALGDRKYSVDPVTNQPIVVNLGHLISKIAELLGYRPLPDGTFTKEQEVSKLRQIVDKNTPVDKTKVGVNNFGSDGMILKRLNNSFSGDKVTADQCVLIHDIPQLLAEYQDQLNLALGLQESSAIEIKSANDTARYHNQLQVLIELLNLSKSNHAAINAALISGLVSQGQTSEIIAALGLPTVTKTIPIQIDNKISHLPYAGIAPHRSISQEIATCTANVGIVLGQVI